MKELTDRANRWVKRFDCDTERKMREGFVEKALRIISEKPLYRKDGTTLFAGLELEFTLTTGNLNLVPQVHRDDVIKQFPECTSVELGAHQLEVTTQPALDIQADGGWALAEDMETRLTNIFRYARNMGVQIARIGLYPLVKEKDIDYTRGAERYTKYHRCPTWHMDHQRSDANKTLQACETVTVSNAYLVGLMNAVHFTVDARDFEDGVDKVNRSLMLSPIALAIGGNARYLNACDTGYSDARFPIWEISHDTRSPQEVASGRPTRIGLPSHYYTKVEDYFHDALSYPFVMNDPISLEHPFEVGIGILWRDARLKFFTEKKTIAVEFRPIALQPTLAEDVAMMLFYLGRLVWSQRENEGLLPMEHVWRNKTQAMRKGLNAQMSYKEGNGIKSARARDILPRELERATKGLRNLGMGEQEARHSMDILKERLSTGNPSELFARTVKEFEGREEEKTTDNKTRRAAIISAMEKLQLLQTPC